MPIMEEGREAKIGGRSRQDPGEPRQPGEARLARGAMGAASAVTVMGAAGQEEEAIVEAIVLRRDVLPVTMPIGPDVMVDLKKDMTKSSGTILGRPLAVSVRFGGPHWPPAGTGSIVVLGLPPPRVECPMGIRQAEGIPLTDLPAQGLI